MISASPVFFAEARSVAGLDPIAGGAPMGPPVAGVDFIAPLICDPRNVASIVVPTAGSLFSQGLPNGDSFDWRKHASLSPVQQQGSCGACWAFAVAGSLSDRHAVVTKTANPVLSPLEMLTCAQSCQPACGTCSPEQGFSYAHRYGIPGGQKPCLLLGPKPPSCTDAKSCSAGALRVYAASTVTTATSIDQIKKEISDRGPVTSVYCVFRDFVVGSDPKRGKPAFEETAGVYVHVDLHPSAYVSPNADAKTLKSMGDLIGYHAVVIVGWGQQYVPYVPGGEAGESLPYWIVRNSYGPKWGMDGDFLVKRGDNDLEWKSNKLLLNQNGRSDQLLLYPAKLVYLMNLFKNFIQSKFCIFYS